MLENFEEVKGNPFKKEDQVIQDNEDDQAKEEEE